ncbi:heavy metal sensor histidine kinase [Vibrio sp. ZSDE26]|uniref:Sensor protein n=1 Tax=Vibrio amylolyticus TaxID=2847292 RepID=A0A9X2BIU9_9VIBR|nr:heavy metal sensor histidine kinase [Vibrio amylolyticus]MCK6264500.1 heavy metal sensor histidine kinase [Vibrio amylolyticus]
MRQQSMASRLILMCFTSSFVVLASFSLIVQYSIEHHFYEQDYQLLQGKAHAISRAIEQQDTSAVSNPPLNSTYYWLLNKDNVITFANSELSLPEGASKESTIEWTANGQHYRGFQFGLESPLHNSMVLALNINHHTNFINKFNIVLLWTFVLTSSVAGLYSIFTVRRGLKPLQDLQEYLVKVSANRLDIRVPLEGLPKELSQLVRTQNEMLDRLQQGFHRLSEFSSDIAHELRTPLTNIMTQTQVTLSSTRSEKEYQNILVSNAEELERLNKTISDTLYLAKTENQLLHSNKEELNLKSLILPLVEYYQIVADEKDVTIEVNGIEVNQFGDKDMLKRAIGNILSNALRHCDAHSCITILIAEDGDYNSIKIKNIGEPILEESLPYLFERFYRADKSRQHNSTVGAGLGLAITKSIVLAHEGDISVSSFERTSEFHLRFRRK